MSNHTAGQSKSLAPRAGAGLAVDQQKAIELLLTGRSVAEAAQLAGVSRATLYRWMRHDPEFGAAFNQWQDELHESSRTRLLTLSEKALAAIERALENGDARTALQLLKGLGLLSPKPIGLTDAEELCEQMEAEKEERHGNRQQKRLVNKTIEEMMG